MKLPTETTANVDRLMAYVQKNDREGAIGFSDCLRDCETRADVHAVLHGVLLTRFEVDVLEEAPRDLNVNRALWEEKQNLDDRSDAIETLHRYGFGSDAFDASFPEVMAYALHNVHPEVAAEEARRAELRAALEATLGCTLAEAAAKIEAALRTPNRNA